MKEYRQGPMRLGATQRGRLWASVLFCCLAASAAAEEAIQRTPTPSPEGARAYFIELEDGAVVSSPLLVRFGLAGMGVAPAGVEREKTGHHHLLIDAGLGDLSLPIPSDANHRHFGGGQTQVSVELPPGEHTLQLVLGDHLHVPHLPPVTSARITVTVK